MNYIKTFLLLGVLTAMFMAVGYLLGGVSGMVLALLFGAVSNLLAWWKSDQLVLRMHKAREVTAREAPDFYSMVAGLAERAELPMPKLYLIDSDAPNAFATGRSPERGAIAMTTGIIRMLAPEELAGVVAHELAHIKNRDTLIMTMSATIAGAISLISQISLFFGGGRDRQLGGIGAILLAIVAPIAAMIVQMTISRTREYAADRLGAQIAGNPFWLVSALKKIGAATQAMRSARRHPATAHMFIVNPLAGTGPDSLFSTHPKMENRIAELMELAEEMGLPTSAAPPVTRRPPQRIRVSPWTGAPVTATRRKSPWG